MASPFVGGYMALSRQDVAVIYEKALAECPLSPKLVLGEVRTIIIEKLVDEIVANALTMDLLCKSLLIQAGWMLGESHFFSSIGRQQTLGLSDMAPHALELMDVLVACHWYIERHWDDFSDSPIRAQLDRAQLATHLEELAQEARTLHTKYEQDGWIVMLRARFVEMQAKAVIFFRLVLGEQAGQGLIDSINQSFAEMRLYVRTSQNTRNAQKHPN